MQNLAFIRVRRSLKKKMNNFYSKEESEDEEMSEDNEIMFLGTTNSDEESEVDIEAEYMAVVDEIERCRKRNKVLKEKLSKYQEETNKIITDLRNQLQEAKKSGEDLLVLLRKRIQYSKKIKKEIAWLKEGVDENILNQSLRTAQGF